MYVVAGERLIFLRRSTDMECDRCGCVIEGFHYDVIVDPLDGACNRACESDYLTFCSDCMCKIFKAMNSEED